MGPETDRWGTFVSGLAPIKRGLSGKVVALFGIDVEAKEFAAGVEAERLKAIMLTALICLAALVALAHQRRFESASFDAASATTKILLRRESTLIVALVGLAVTLMAFFEVRMGMISAFKDECSEHFGTRVSAFSQALADMTDRLDALRLGISGAASVTAEEFDSLGVVLASEACEGSVLEWVPLVRRGGRDAFEKNGRSKFSDDFRLTEDDGRGGLRTAKDRDEYFPVLYAEPYVDSARPVGFDIGALPETRQILDSARDSGISFASSRMSHIRKGAITDYVMTVYAPVYSQKTIPELLDARRQMLKGFLVMSFPMSSFIEGALRKLPHGKFAAKIEEITSDSYRKLLYSHVPDDEAFNWDVAASIARYESSLVFAETAFRIVIVPSDSFLSRHYPRSFWAILPIGILLTIGTVAYLNFMLAARLKAEALVLERTSELRASEMKFHSLFRTMTEGVALHKVYRGADGKPSGCMVVEVNPAYEKLVGLAANDIIGRNINPLSDLKSVPFSDIYTRVVETGKPYSLEAKISSLSKSFNISVFSTSKDTFATILLDVTKRWELLEELKYRYIQLSTQQEVALDGILVVNSSGKIDTYNKRFLEIWNVPREVLEQRSDDVVLELLLLKVINPGQFLTKVRHLYDHPGETSRDELLLKDGRILDRYSVSMFSPDRKYYGRVWFFRDITDARMAEKALRDSEMRYRALVETTDTGFTILDKEGRIMDANPVFVRMTGCGSLSDIKGKNMIEWVVPQDVERASKALRRCITDGFLQNFELDYHDASGHLISMEINATVVSLGGISQVFSLCRDITERRRAMSLLKEQKDQIEKANQELHAAIASARQLALEADDANKSKGEFLAKISHDIRTPVNGVIGMSRLLLDTEIPTESRRYVDIIRSSGEMLLTLVNEILDLSKIEAKKLELDISDFDLNSAVDDTMDMLTVKASEKGLELNSLIDPDVPCLIRGDPTRVRQILSNLAGNAVKFTESGEVFLHVSLESESDADATMLFTISDTGIGIPEDQIGRLFSPFAQVDGSSRKYGGTGLGLAISRQLAEMMGGGIRVESRLGEGSKFLVTVVLPKRPCGLAEAPPRRRAADLSGVKALVVDDQSSSRMVQCVYLKSWGCRVEETDGPELGLDALRKAAESHNPFQIALMSMSLPGMGVEAFAAAVRGRPSPERPADGDGPAACEVGGFRAVREAWLSGLCRQACALFPSA